jgi:dephospho-CoA kinase
MKVIGLTGTNGAGKDAVAELLGKQGYQKITIGDVIRARMSSEGIKAPSREQAHEYQKRFVDKFGIDYWPKEIIKEIKKHGWTKVAISGLRYPSDIRILKQEFGKDFIAILVDADSKIRYQRLAGRGRADAPKTYAEFLEQEKNEEKTFNLKETFRLIDFRVDNSGNLERTRTQVTRILLKAGFT